MSNATVTYIRLHTLRTRGPIEQREPRDVNGTLLVGDRCVLDYTDRHSETGHDRVTVYPAFADGQQCWFVIRDWQAAHGYSAYGTAEYTLSMSEGIALLIERGVFALEPGMRSERNTAPADPQPSAVGASAPL